jgi:F0F1-type ATP synthase assembly protein I
MDFNQDPSHKKLKQYNSYLKYSGLGIQLLITLGISGWLGYLLDGYLNIKLPVFMLLFGFTAFGVTLYRIYRTISKDD